MALFFRPKHSFLPLQKELSSTKKQTEFSLAKYTIVVVDDDTITLDIITFALEDGLQANVIAFSRSEMAYDFLINQSPDNLSLIISDQNMPQYNGLELLKACSEKGLQTPFVLLTGEATRDTVMAAKKGGATTFLAKPFETEHLIQKVKQLVD